MFNTQAPFCEYYLNRKKLPETWNAITSTTYSILAVFLFFASSTTDFTMGSFFISTMFILGASSFIFHYTLWNVAGNMDVLLTLCVSYFGAFLCLQSTASFFSDVNFFTILTIVLQFLYCIAVAIWFSPENAFPFYQLVAFPQIFVLFCVCLVNAALCVLNFSRETKRAICYMDIGVAILSLSALAPILLDRSCKENEINVHPLWHVGSAYGIHLLVQSFLYLNSAKRGRGYRFRSDNFLYFVFPCIISDQFN